MKRALYYPYIHIDDINWLRGTLLLFTSVSRMLPPAYKGGPNDDPSMMAFENAGLVRRADLFNQRSYAAQEALVNKLTTSLEDPTFLQRYGRDAAIAQLTPDHPYGFQIHSDKVTFPVRDELIRTRLAWPPVNCEPYDEDHGYVQMHPRVGQAIMATIAVASAQHEGLDIIGDARSGPIYEALLDKDLDVIYDTWLGKPGLQPPSPASSHEIFEFFIGTNADVSQVSPETLKALDREPLTSLLEELAARARQIPAMDPGPQRDEYLAQAISEIVSDWREDRKNLSRYWRAFLGGGVSEDVTTFAKRGADGATTAIGASAASGIAGAALLHNAFSGLEQGIFAAIGALVVGISTRAIASFRKVSQATANSPYRYLSMLEDAGITFRTADTPGDA